VSGLAIATLVLFASLYLALRAYTFYLAHRVVSLLDQAAQIRLGDTEGSILPLVAHYGGYKWTPPPPVSSDDCPVKAQCDYQNSHILDYAYEVDLSPFHVFSGWNLPKGRIQSAIAKLMIETPSSWRDPLSLRNWLVYVHVRIRAGRVEAVHSGLFVEGRTRWLGNTWELSADMPRLYMPLREYTVDGSFLTFPGNGGAGTMHHLTPAATPEQFQAARNIDVRCLTGLTPCRCLSDLTPRAFEYQRRHPEVGSSFSNEDCPKP
jgi:hypothetical protein